MGSMGKKTTSQPFIDRHVRSALSRLGVFIRNFLDGSGFASELWHQWGYRSSQMQGDFWHSIVHPDDRGRVIAAELAIKKGNSTSFEQEYRIRTADGQWRWLLSRGRIVTWTEAGDPEWYIGTDMDITDAKMFEAELREAKIEAEQRAQEAETLRVVGAIVASSLDIKEVVSVILDQAVRVVPYEAATVQILSENGLNVLGDRGWDVAESIGGYTIPVPGNNPHTQVILQGTPRIVSAISSEYADFAASSPCKGGSWLGIPLVVRKRTIGLIQFETRSTGFFTQDHLRLGLSLADHVAVALHNARLYEESRTLAQTDSLTGIGTRRALFLRAQELLGTERRRTRDLTLLMLDVDHFKRINDEFGHATGDTILVQVAQACLSVLRASDVVGRYGGDEFIILLPATRKSHAILIADRLREAVSRIQLPEPGRTVTISIGITRRITRSHAASKPSLSQYVEQADRALYLAKQNGRDRWEYLTLPEAIQ